MSEIEILVDLRNEIKNVRFHKRLSLWGGKDSEAYRVITEAIKRIEEDN